MTAVAIPSTGSPAAVPPAGLEVLTLNSDALRASIRVSGVLTTRSSTQLTDVLRTHISAGRRYLRVDLATAQMSDPAVINALVAAHRMITDLGGMLVFENAGPQVIDAIRASHLFTRPVAS